MRFGINPFWRIGQDEEGELLFDAGSAKSVMDGFKAKGLDSIAIDLDHQIVNGGSSDTAGKAYGWFTPEVRTDGLYAVNVKWTPEGEALLRGKSYRFFSPTVQTDKSGRVLDLLPLALTNLPSLKGINALVAANATAKTNMKTVLTALNLGEDADETIALSAVEVIKADSATLLGLFNAKSVGEAVGIITALKAKAEQVETLSAEVAALRAEKTEAEVVSMIDQAVKDGRVPPAKRADMVALSAKHGVEALKGFLSLMGKQPAQGPAVQAPAEAPKAAPNGVTEQVANIFGLSAGAVAKTALPTDAQSPKGLEALANVFGVQPAVLSARPATSLPIATSTSDR